MTKIKKRSRQGKVGTTGIIEWTTDSVEKMGSLVVDGWKNVITGLGSGRDKRLAAKFQAGDRITHAQELLDEMYHGDDLIGRIVDLPPNEMYREWVDFTASTDGEGTDTELSSLVLQDLDALGAQEAFTTAESWARLKGGALILLGINEGGAESEQEAAQQAAEPVDLDRVKSLDFLTVLDRFDVEVHTTYDDPLSAKFGMPETYRLTGTSAINSKSGTNELGNEYGTIIHESRTIRFDGVRTSRRRRRENNGWSDSVLERYQDVIRDFQGASGGIMHLLQDFSQAVFKIKGLAKALAADADNLVLKRLMMADMARSIVRAVPLDADAEEFERKGAGVAGMADLYDRMMMRVSAATGIPVTLLFGRSPAGMNATGESDIRLFYDSIKALQETKARPRLEYLLEIMLNADEGPTGGEEPKSWNFEWNPLFQETAKEQAETRKIVAETDAIYLDRKVISKKDVRTSRWGGDTYSPETVVDFEEMDNREEADDIAREMLTQVGSQEVENVDGYRLVTDADDMKKRCATCRHSGGTPMCSKYAFAFDPGHVCDAFDEFRPVKLKRRRRGRNA